MPPAQAVNLTRHEAAGTILGGGLSLHVDVY